MLEALHVIWACGLDLAAHLVETRSTVLPVLLGTWEHGPPPRTVLPGGSTVLPKGARAGAPCFLGSTGGPRSTGGPVLPRGSTGGEQEHGPPYVSSHWGARGNI